MVLWESGTRVVGCSSVLSPNISFSVEIGNSSKCRFFFGLVFFGGKVCGSGPPAPGLRGGAEGDRVSLPVDSNTMIVIYFDQYL